MVRHVFTFTSLLFGLISAVSALPAPPRHEITSAPPHVQAIGPSGIPNCSLPPSTTVPAVQTLERRANSRKRRAQARAANPTLSPKATAKERGHTGAPRTKPKPPMTASKKAKVDQRKENRKLGRKQKHAAKVADALQKQKPPPYGIDPSTGALRKPEQADVAKKVWANKQKAQADKATRKAAYNALSPTDKAAHDAASAAKQAASRQKHITDNTKENNRQHRIRTKDADNASRKAANRKDATTARASYATAQGMPRRADTYTSPQGKPYNGKDVRQAVFYSELANAKGGVGYNALTGKASKNKDKLPKDFQNRPNSDGSTPLAGAVPAPGNALKEFPIMHDKQMGHDGRKPAPTEARIITQKDAAGQTELKGLIGHPAGTDDHKSF